MSEKFSSRTKNRNKHLWTGRDLYRALLAVTLVLRLNLICRTTPTPFSSLSPLTITKGTEHFSISDPFYELFYYFEIWNYMALSIYLNYLDYVFKLFPLRLYEHISLYDIIATHFTLLSPPVFVYSCNINSKFTQNTRSLVQ